MRGSWRPPAIGDRRPRVRIVEEAIGHKLVDGLESTDSWPSPRRTELEIPPPISSYGFQKLATEYFARASASPIRVAVHDRSAVHCVGIGERRALGDVESSAET